jgi:transaldolase
MSADQSRRSVADNPLRRLHDHGQSFWWDSLSRHALDKGELKRMRDEDGVRGITSNPTIFHEAIARSDDYDAAIVRLAGEGKRPAEIFWELAVLDIKDACAVLRPVYDESEGGDGFVSLEVDPHLAYDAAATVAQAKALWQRVGCPNLMIKIPGTAQGLPAIRECLTAGLNVNVTLLFAQRAHEDVMLAYLDALEERVRRDQPVDRIASVASFFVSRVDSLVDARLDATGTDLAQALRGKAAIANARQAYQNFLRIFSGKRWKTLVAKGARVQRPLWASTSTKDKAYSDVMYVETLIGRDTVNTMPTATIAAYRDHGQPAPDRVLQDADWAITLFRKLAALGLDMDEITELLLRDGVDKFAKSFDDLLASLQEKAQRLSGAAR